MVTVFRSKIDSWLVAVLGVAMAVALYAALATFSTGSPAAWLIAIFTLGIGLGLPLWLVQTTRYTLDPDQLLVQSGPFKWRVPLSQITAITPTSNALSAPAWSLNRLRIDYGPSDSVMISPSDQVQFLRAIKAARTGAP